MIIRGFPSPLEHPLPTVTTPDGQPREPISCDPEGPLVAEVVKTTTDPYVGRLSLVRVFSGTLVADATVHVSGHFAEFTGSDRGHADHDVDERVGAVSMVTGATLVPVAKGSAGDIVAVARLSRAETGDTLSDPGAPALMEPWAMPEPLLPTAVTARTSTDEDKLSQGLARLVAEDPTVRVEQNPDTHQMVLWSMGEAHLEVLLDRLQGPPRRRRGHDCRSGSPCGRRCRNRPAAKGRHVKQSGGHGQYAVCDIEVEPLPEGGGFEFVDRVVGGAVPRQFIPSVEKGVRAQMDKGVAGGYPMVDLRVTLVGGKAHSVDSSDAAFQMAGSLALKEASAAAGVAMLEPIDDGAGDRGRRVRGHDHGRPVGPTWSGDRDDVRRQRSHRGHRRGARDRTHPVRDRPAQPCPRHRVVHPQLSATRPDATTPGRKSPVRLNNLTP